MHCYAVYTCIHVEKAPGIYFVNYDVYKSIYNLKVKFEYLENIVLHFNISITILFSYFTY